MKLIALSLSALLLAAPAFAFETDSQTMGSQSASAKFSDPDDATPMSSAVYMNGNASQNNGSTDLNTIHYEYDPTSGMYVPSTDKQ